ncbi:MAG: DUF2085 domain-containing protein [Ignavibacteria bacterium]|nr:DUF2085 domain-containing protein [Ignavibacteria bacterium]
MNSNAGRYSADIDFSRKIYFAILLLSLLWNLLIFTAPLLAGNEGLPSAISDFLYVFFSKVCHQEDSRSFHFFGNKLGVCSRCVWMYAGFFTGTALYPLKYRINNTESPSTIYLYAASALVLADVIGDLTGIIGNTFLSRSVTGFIIGAVLPFFLIPGFIKFFYEVNSFLKNKISYKN